MSHQRYVQGSALTLREKLSFGVGDMAVNIAFTTLGFYFTFFAVNVAGLPAAWAGIIFAIAKIWDAVTDYFMGTLSDRTRSRFGRRRPYILAGSIPLAICFALLWRVPFTEPEQAFVYYLVVILLFNTAFTAVSVPYNAMLPELTDSYDERTNVTAYRMCFAFLGSLLAAAGVTLIVDVVYAGVPEYGQSYPLMGLMFGALIFLILLVTFFGTREKPQAPTVAREGIFSQIKTLLAMREFRRMLGMFLFSMIALDIFMAVVLFFLKDVVRIKDDMLMFALMGVPLLAAIAAAPLWVLLGEKLGKVKAYAWSTLAFSLVLLGFFFAPEGNVGYTIAIAILAGIGVSAAQIIPWSIMPDINELDEHRHGVRREGAVYGITIFLYKAASAIAILLVSTVLSISGYVEGAVGEQPESAVSAVRALIGIAPGICALIAAGFALGVNIDRDSFNRMKAETAARKYTR